MCDRVSGLDDNFLGLFELYTLRLNSKVKSLEPSIIYLNDFMCIIGFLLLLKYTGKIKSYC